MNSERLLHRKSLKKPINPIQNLSEEKIDEQISEKAKNNSQQEPEKKDDPPTTKFYKPDEKDIICVFNLYKIQEKDQLKKKNIWKVMRALGLNPSEDEVKQKNAEWQRELEKSKQDRTNFDKYFSKQEVIEFIKSLPDQEKTQDELFQALKVFDKKDENKISLKDLKKQFLELEEDGKFDQLFTDLGLDQDKPIDLKELALTLHQRL